MKRLLTICALTASAIVAQTTVTGSKTMQGNWDASGASATKPAKSGATLPATCGTGELFFNTNSVAGQNLYLCAPDNVWTQLSAGVNTVFGRTGSISAQTGDYNFSQLTGAASTAQLPAAGGDLSGSLTAATVKSIQGKPVSATSPSSGQVLTWNGSQWVGSSPAGTLGGDVSGSISAATVQAIQGHPVAAAVPAAGQVLTWNGSAWGPQNTSGGSGGGGSPQAVIFDGSTTSLSDGSTVAWSACATNAMCATWTVPGGVYWVAVDVWAGGDPGLGAGNGSGGAGGPGGGYGRRYCAVSSGGNVTVQVGLGGISGSGYGATLIPGGDSSFGDCIGASAGQIISVYAYGNPPGAMKINGQSAPPGPYLANNTYYNTLMLTGWVSAAQTAGYVAVREDQGGWPGSGWIGGTGAGYAAGPAIGGGGGGGGGAAQNAVGGAAGVSMFGGAGGAGGSSSGNCTVGAVPGGGGGGAYVAASGNTTGCNGGRGEIRVYYVH